MKYITIILMTLLTLTAISCGYLEEGACAGDCKTDGDSDTRIAGRASLDRVSVYSVDDEFIGFAMAYHFDYIKVFIPAYQSYVTMHPNTGEYLEYPVSQYEEIYFGDRDCTGDAVMLNWSGKIGSTYIKAKNQLTYLINSTTYFSMQNRFKAASRLVANRPASDSCRNAATFIETYAANLVINDSMPDLTSYAPFQMFSDIGDE